VAQHRKPGASDPTGFNCSATLSQNPDQAALVARGRPRRQGGLDHGGGHPERGGRELSGWSKARSDMVNACWKLLLRPQFWKSSFDTDFQPLPNGREVIMCILRRHINASRTLPRSIIGHWPDSDGADRIQRCRSQDIAILVEQNV
jgi:hypothetical protein